MVSSSFVVFGMGLWSAFNHVPWSSIFLLTQIFGVRLHVVQEREACAALQKRVSWSTHLVNEKNCGYFFNSSFIGYIATTFNPSEAWLICTDQVFKELTTQKEEKVRNDEGVEIDASIIVWDRVGSYENPWFKKRRLAVSYEPRKEQERVMTCIKEKFGQVVHGKLKPCVVALIHGEAGTGKSMVGLLLAAELKASYCNSLKPWQPGDSISLIYSEIEPTRQHPLVIVFDEFDGALQRVHNNEIENHKKTPTAVQDKEGWNRMFDYLSRGLYPNVIVIITTNKTPAFFDDLDPSYIRSGRVDLVCEIVPT
jgi:SpoVK/Ycf46/Vps4 family AAA+-type ATPase